ncbi:head-tail connector protein [Sphingomonas sp. KR1UV-12]|uniref:Head-tail connector protein n=1 Tax=Sphingomonas aurea TaxID=3063994 RepID=A0ABT9EHT1_9SPHN|nr:head-tail connector protein [Sphingomonas sp. KR1UV-12]MDP1026390.1 head-tail connector protein [Sphingomonas sp. KR1UV-12]
MLGEPITLEQAKQQLKLEADDVEQDGRIALLIPAARRAIENATGLVIVGDGITMNPADAPVIVLAMLLQVDDWFTNGVTGEKVSAPVAAVLGPLRTWVMR